MNAKASMDTIKLAAWGIVDQKDDSWTLGEVRKAFDSAIKDQRVAELVAAIMMETREKKIYSWSVITATGSTDECGHTDSWAKAVTDAGAALEQYEARTRDVDGWINITE